MGALRVLASYLDYVGLLKVSSALWPAALSLTVNHKGSRAAATAGYRIGERTGVQTPAAKPLVLVDSPVAFHGLLVSADSSKRHLSVVSSCQ